MGAVDIKQTSEHELTLEWDSSAANDMIADSTLAVITEIDKSPASVKGMVTCDVTCKIYNSQSNFDTQ
jgi:Pre-mRNA 3'-end-processing endonuclease polyadenylation factor C-term